MSAVALTILRLTHRCSALKTGNAIASRIPIVAPKFGKSIGLLSGERRSTNFQPQRDGGGWQTTLASSANARKKLTRPLWTHKTEQSSSETVQNVRAVETRGLRFPIESWKFSIEERDKKHKSEIRAYNGYRVRLRCVGFISRFIRDLEQYFFPTDEGFGGYRM